MPATTASPADVSCSPTRPVIWTVMPLRLKSGLNSLKDSAPGPPALIRNRLLSASRGWIGVMLIGCSSCDWSSSLTRAISWRGSDRVGVGQEAVRGEVAWGRC